MPKRNEKAEAELPAYDLRADREARGLTQEETAVILCVHQTSIGVWERTGAMPRIYRKAWLQHWELEDIKNAKAKVGKQQKEIREANAKRKAKAGGQMVRGTNPVN